MLQTSVPVLLLILTLVAGNHGVVEAKESASEDAGNAVEQSDEGNLSNQQYQYFLQALQLQGRSEWESSLRADAKKILFLSNQARLNERQQRWIDFAAKGAIQRWQIRQWRKKLQVAIQLDKAERDEISTAVSGGIQSPKGWLLWNIFLAWPEGGDFAEREKTRTRLDEIRAAIINGADFSEQARRFSQSSSRYLDGRIGWVRLGRITPSLRVVIERLGNGDYSPIVENTLGVSFYFAEKVRPARTISRAVQIDNRMRSELKKKRKKAWAYISEQAQRIAEADLQQRWIGHAKTLEREKTDKILEDATPITLQDLIHWNNTFTQTQRISAQDNPRDIALAYLRTQLLADGAADAGIQPLPEMRDWLIHYFRAQSEFNRLAASKAAKVREEEIDDYYRKHPGNFQAPPRWDASLIQFDYHSGNQSEVKSLAHRVSKSIKKGELSFAEAAKRHSTAPSAANRGRLGSQSTNQLLFLDPIALRTLKTMDAGQIEGPIPGNQKLILLLLHGKSPATQRPLSEVREQIRKTLRLEKLRHAGDEILSALALR